jgi:hypothetical protein
MVTGIHCLYPSPDGKYTGYIHTADEEESQEEEALDDESDNRREDEIGRMTMGELGLNSLWDTESEGNGEVEEEMGEDSDPEVGVST